MSLDCVLGIHQRHTLNSPSKQCLIVLPGFRFCVYAVFVNVDVCAGSLRELTYLLFLAVPRASQELFLAYT